MGVLSSQGIGDKSGDVGGWGVRMVGYNGRGPHILILILSIRYVLSLGLDYSAKSPKVIQST